MNFWNAILESNTFNFAILLLIFSILYKKLNVSSLVENLKSEVVKRIEDAKQERLQASQKLKDAQKSVENLDNEIKSQLSDATQKAENLSKQIISSAEEKVQQAVAEAQETQQSAAEPPIEEVTAPTEETPTEAPTAVQEQAQPTIYEVKFAVRGTIEQLKKLKQFIMQVGMSYDDI